MTNTTKRSVLIAGGRVCSSHLAKIADTSCAQCARVGSARSITLTACRTPIVVCATRIHATVRLFLTVAKPMTMKKQKDKSFPIIATIAKELARWKYIHENGSRGYEFDGESLYCVRNHIFFNIQKLKESGIEIDVKIPPEMDMNYMAKPDEIRTIASQSLQTFENSEHLQYLLKLSALSKVEKEHFCYDAIVEYYTKLKRAIETDDLKTMRGYCHPFYLENFQTCADSIRIYLHLKQERKNLSDYLTH